MQRKRCSLSFQPKKSLPRSLNLMSRRAPSCKNGPFHDSFIHVWHHHSYNHASNLCASAYGCLAAMSGSSQEALCLFSFNNSLCHGSGRHCPVFMLRLGLPQYQLCVLPKAPLPNCPNNTRLGNGSARHFTVFLLRGKDWAASFVITTQNEPLIYPLRSRSSELNNLWYRYSHVNREYHFVIDLP